MDSPYGFRGTISRLARRTDGAFNDFNTFIKVLCSPGSRVYGLRRQLVSPTCPAEAERRRKPWRRRKRSGDDALGEPGITKAVSRSACHRSPYQGLSTRIP